MIPAVLSLTGHAAWVVLCTAAVAGGTTWFCVALCRDIDRGIAREERGDARPARRAAG